MACLALSRVRVSASLSILVLAGLTAASLLVARATLRGQAAYTLISADARRTLPIRTVNGIDMIHWNAADRIDHFKVMVRPLKAVNKLHEMMGRELQRGAAPP